MKSALTLWKWFSGSECISRLDGCIAALQHCSIAALQHCSIAALQQMESTWNEARNGPLSHS
jgi:hypothetical protein